MIIAAATALTSENVSAVRERLKLSGGLWIREDVLRAAIESVLPAIVDSMAAHAEKSLGRHLIDELRLSSATGTRVTITSSQAKSILEVTCR